MAQHRANPLPQHRHGTVRGPLQGCARRATATLGARVTPEQKLEAQKLEAQFRGRWEIVRGVWEWHAFRRCGHSCSQPQTHGSRHIGRADTLKELEDLLKELDDADRTEVGPVR